MSLGDAIIASAALVYGLILITRNVNDFRWKTQLILWNPFESDQPS
jgi:predicted nucleic acid-binding protein